MKKKKLTLLIVCLGIAGLLIVSFIIALISLYTGSSGLSEKDYSEGKYADEAMMASGKAESFEATAGSRNKETDKKIIKTGSLDLVVKKVNDAVNQITIIAVKKEGFVSNSKIYTSEDKVQYGTITIRVPVKYFEETIDELKAIAEIVEEESISGVDVTEEFIDLQSRLKNLKIEEAQYQKILERAWEIEDVLNVTEYLFDTREDIERIEGRIKYLENLTDLSTISVYLSEEPRIEIPAGIWKPLTTIKKAFMAMLEFWQGIINILIWLIIFLVPLGIIVWVIAKIVKKIRKK